MSQPPKAKIYISRKQRLFIRTIRSEVVTLGEIMSRCKIDGARLAIWLERKPFNRALHRALRTAKRRQKLELSLGAAAAIHQLVERSSEPTETGRKACGDLARFDRARNEIPRRAREISALETTPSSAHPDLETDQAEAILNALELENA